MVHGRQLFSLGLVAAIGALGAPADVGFCAGKHSVHLGESINQLKCHNLSGNRLRLLYDTTGDLKPVPDGYRTLLSSPLLPSMYEATGRSGSNLIISTREEYVQDSSKLADLNKLERWIWRFPIQYPHSDADDCQPPEIDEASGGSFGCDGGRLEDFCLTYRHAGVDLVELKYQLTLFYPRALAKVTGYPRAEVTMPSLSTARSKLRSSLAVEGLSNNEASHTFYTLSTAPATTTLYELGLQMHSGLFLKLEGLSIPPGLESEATNNIYIAALVSCAV